MEIEKKVVEYMNGEIAENDFVDFVIKNEIDLNYEYKNIGNILVYAINEDNFNAVKLFLNFGVNFTRINPSDGLEIYKNFILADRTNMIKLLTNEFWFDYFSETLILCAKTKNTKFLAEVMEYIKPLSEKLSLTLSEKETLTSLLFYASLRNESHNMILFLQYGAELNFDYYNVNITAILKRNLFEKSLKKIEKKYVLPFISNVEPIDDFLNNNFAEHCVDNFNIDEISFMIAKHGGKILEGKLKNDEMLIEIIMKKNQPAFFLRMFRIMNNRSEFMINRLIEKAKNNNQNEIIEILIEESVL